MTCDVSTVVDALRCLIDQAAAGPDWFDVTSTLLVPTLAAVATVFIAYASWKTARRATAIASAALDAEKDRAKEEHYRVQEAWRREYASRLDAHFAQMFEALGNYSYAHERWLAECNDLELSWGGHPDDIPYPPAPSRALVDARLQATMLHARNEDRIVLGRIDGYIRAVFRSSSTWKASHRLSFAVDLIRKWRDESCSADTFMSRLKRKRAAVDEDIDQPPRRY